jgi:hypothetical protein
MPIKDSMKIVEIPITLQAIRIDGKKLTASTLEQFPIVHLFQPLPKYFWAFKKMQGSHLNNDK